MTNEEVSPEPDGTAPPSIWIGLVPMTLTAVTAVIASLRVWDWWPPW